MSIVFLRKSLLLLLFTTAIFSQQKEFIDGRLIDSKTQESIVFATIKIKNKARGVISNMDGGFKIPTQYRAYGDTLEISSMGYVSKSIILLDLLEDKINVIELDVAIEVLDEVVVRGSRRNTELSAAQIVHIAISKIGVNYPKAPFSNVGYYRDYQLKEGKYVNLNEAIMEVFDQGFTTLDYETSKSRIYDYKRNIDFPRDTIAEKPYDYETKGKIISGAILNDYGGNEFTILKAHDAIRNHGVNSFGYVDRLDIDFEKNHEFTKEGNTILDNQKLYAISIRQSVGPISVKGNLFISQNNFSIYKMEYSMYRENQKYGFSQQSNFTKGSRNMIFDVKVEYKENDDLMYLNYLSINNVFQIVEAPIFSIHFFQVNWDKKCYIVHFSQAPKMKSAERLSKYRIKYKGNKVKIESLKIIGDKVLLFPDMRIGNLSSEIFSSKQKDINSNDFDIKIKNLKDINGNLLNHSKTTELNQFREFFSQQVKPYHRDSLGSSYMRKNRPIFKDQPIVRPDNFSDYWMNTPLPNIKK